MGSAILLFSKSCHRHLSKHQSWTPLLFEQVLLVYYQLLQNYPFSVQLLRSQLSHKGLAEDLLLGADCSRELYCHHNSHSCIVLSNTLSSAENLLFFCKTFPELVLDGSIIHDVTRAKFSLAELIPLHAVYAHHSRIPW